MMLILCATNVYADDDSLIGQSEYDYLETQKIIKEVMKDYYMKGERIQYNHAKTTYGVATPEASPKAQAEGTEEGIQETILVPPTNEAPKAPKEPEDTLVEKSLTAPKGPTITPISIVDAPPIEESTDVEVPELESEQTTLYEPELVTKEPSYFENAQNLSDAEKNENPLDPKDDPDVNKVLPPENPGTPLQETPYATSIHDSSTYVPFDDGADVQKNHFNEAPVTMPTGSVNPKQMAPLGGGATALTPNQLP